MPINVQTPDSPGWWMRRANRQLLARQPRYERLRRYFEGDPPLPTGAEACREAYRAFQRKSRTNFAELVIEAMLDRVRLRAVRTAADDDIDGDDVAMRYARQNRLSLGLKDFFEWGFTYGRACMSVGSVEPSIGAPLIRAEDPRQTIVLTDPVTRERRAAFKIFHDDTDDRDLAYLWLPGELHVATRSRRALNNKVTFSPGAFSWDDDLSADWDEEIVPVVEFHNRNGVGEFERHTDVLDRINHMLLQRMVIATFQAFKQRVLKGTTADNMPERDAETGQPIDYDALFSGDPGALWTLPDGVEPFEFEPTDFRPILEGTKDDVMHFGAVTRTPLSMFTPDAINQSAEGVQSTTEGLVYKVEDREERATPELAEVFRLAFMFDPDNRYLDVDGQRVDRADADRIGIDWVPPERYSLAERGSAAAQAAGNLPREAIWADIWQYTPEQIRRMRTMQLDDLAFDAASTVATEPTPAAPAPTPTPAPAPPASGQ